MSRRNEVLTDSGEPMYGYLVEFEDIDVFIEAVERVRDSGYTKWDTHTPFVVHGLDGAMGVRATKLPLLVFGGGLAGTVLGIGLQWWTNAVDYPFLISGKPMFSLPANIPVAFETTILLAALTALGGMLWFNGLPRLYHPLFRSEAFKRATDDRFFISVEAADPIFKKDETRALMESLQGVGVEEIEE